MTLFVFLTERASIQSEPFATTLFDLLSPHLPPDFPSFQKHLVPAPKPVLCNPNIRLYKYTQGQFFGPHYDDSVPGPSIPVKQEQEQAQMAVVVPGDTSAGTSAAVKGKTVTSRSQGTRGKPKSAPQPRAIPTWSEWTILIYLTGQEDGITGGETVFYMDEGIGKNRTRREIVPPLTRGTALLHRHGKECLLHEGRLVERGTKYVLRSDLLFGQIA
ncbi:hypothetical protein FRC19_003636 [Serendipita sp. 401]|nr:hypothetical protein FRC15_004194 [Serendipita sp. 397]KAG8811725.1 hypothetical protein FRC19_003636 [Serendipita sp. 401]